MHLNLPHNEKICNNPICVCDTYGNIFEEVDYEQ